MPVNYKKLGERIRYFRHEMGISQEEFSEKLNLSREFVTRIETAKRIPSLDTLVEIANLLHISIDDLLVDSLSYSVSTADTELHYLLLDCNQTEKEILMRTVKELKTILYGLGI